MKILDTSSAPNDPVERVIWLDAVLEQVRAELEIEYQQAYFEARLSRRFEEALRAGRASKKRALAWTRRQNEANGRTVRWRDGQDTVTSTYRTM